MSDTEKDMHLAHQEFKSNLTSSTPESVDLKKAEQALRLLSFDDHSSPTAILAKAINALNQEVLPKLTLSGHAPLTPKQKEVMDEVINKTMLSTHDAEILLRMAMRIQNSTSKKNQNTEECTLKEEALILWLQLPPGYSYQPKNIGKSREELVEDGWRKVTEHPAGILKKPIKIVKVEEWDKHMENVERLKKEEPEAWWNFDANDFVIDWDRNEKKGCCEEEKVEIVDQSSLH